MTGNKTLNIKKVFSLYSEKKAFDLIIDLAKRKEMTDSHIAELAILMAESGEQLNLSHELYYDIPSTGGPSSLSTIICPYIFVEFGKMVPKLGVKGRPAGGIDVLRQITDYRIVFNKKEILDCLSKSGYCHLITNKNITPLDKSFFAYRSEIGAKAIPELVIASILSKKLALGIKNIGIDIRVFKGANFGENIAEAQRNAEKFISVATKLGISSKCFISEIIYPLQPYIGRGEALIALKKILENDMSSWLREHFDSCLKMVLSTIGDNSLDMSGFKLENLVKHFENNLIAQNSSLPLFYKKVEEKEKSKYFTVSSSQNGFLRIDLDVLRDTILKYQGKDGLFSFSDNIGVVLFKKTNEFVFKDEPLCKIRSFKQRNIENIIKDVEKSFSFKNEIVNNKIIQL